MGSKVSKILKTVAPLALMAVPGVGQALGGALLGAGASTAATGALGSGLLGAGIGAIGGGGIKGALTGGVTGGLGGYASGGGLSGILGSAAHTLPAGVSGPVSAGSGLLGGLSNVPGIGSLVGATTGSSGGGLSSIFGGSGGGLASAAGNLYSGISGNAAIGKQTAAMTAANKNALALQAKMYDQTSANMSPFLTAGTSANSRLSDLLGTSGNTGASGFGSLGTPFSVESFQADPGYQFRLAEGTKAMNQSLGARGSLFSGAALKAAQDFGQGLADQTYQDAYNRYNADQANQYNMLSGQSQNGQNAAANLGSTGANYANAAGGLMSNQGNITAAGSQATQNNTNQSLANILGSNVGGFTGSSMSLTPDQIILLKRQLGMA